MPYNTRCVVDGGVVFYADYRIFDQCSGPRGLREMRNSILIWLTVALALILVADTSAQTHDRLHLPYVRLNHEPYTTTFGAFTGP